MERYQIPEKIPEFQEAFEIEEQNPSKPTPELRTPYADSRSEFFWVFPRNRKENTHEPVRTSSLIEDLLHHKEHFPFYINRSMSEPLEVYGLQVTASSSQPLQCKLCVYVLVDGFLPLSVRIFNEGFVKLIQGPHFLANCKQARARLLYSEMVRLLESKRKFSEESVNGLWDEICQRIILVLLSMIYKFEVTGLESRTFQLLSFEFMIDSKL